MSGTTEFASGESNSEILLDGTAPSYSGTDLTNPQNKYLGSGVAAGASELIVFDPPITSDENIHMNCFLQPNGGSITVNVGETGV